MPETRKFHTAPSMARTCAGIAFGKLRVIDGMGVDRMEPGDIAAIGNHHIEPDIIRLVQLVGGLFEIIIDLCHAAGEAGAVMPVRVEGFNDEVGRACLRAQRWRTRSWCVRAAFFNARVGSGGLSRAAKNAA